MTTLGTSLVFINARWPWSGSNYLKSIRTQKSIIKHFYVCWTTFLFFIFRHMSDFNFNDYFFYEAASFASENKHNCDRWRENFHQRICRLFPTWYFFVKVWKGLVKHRPVCVYWINSLSRALNIGICLW